MSRIAAIQMASGPNISANLLEASGLIGRAAAAGAGLVVLPENFRRSARSNETSLVPPANPAPKRIALEPETRVIELLQTYDRRRSNTLHGHHGECSSGSRPVLERLLECRFYLPCRGVQL